jgi:hypothetical protein
MLLLYVLVVQGLVVFLIARTYFAGKPKEAAGARETDVQTVADVPTDPSVEAALARARILQRQAELMQSAPPEASPRFARGTPAADLLPAPPKVNKAPVYLGDDLARVPELALEDLPTATAEEWRERRARTAAAALHLNGREEDGFLKALVAHRPDLAGAPFAMGAACRTTGDRAKAFKDAALAVQGSKGAALLASGAGEGPERCERSHKAHLAVASQVMAGADVPGQVALVRGLASVPRPEAARELARVTVFSTEEAVRAAAIEALAVRREGAEADVLAAGLRYPWPAAAENAAHAIAKLKRTDLVPQLKGALSAPDPRGPRDEVVGGRRETVAYELVRVNHLRNCLLCHAPAERGKTPVETLVAEVPVPAESLPRSGYGQSGSNLLVRIDVTYLRPDFSASQQVTDWTAKTWPAVQRFDFLVRRRVLSPAEAADLRERLKGPSPYRRAAERALRELVGERAEARAAFNGLTRR